MKKIIVIVIDNRVMAKQTVTPLSEWVSENQVRRGASLLKTTLLELNVISVLVTVIEKVKTKISK